MAALPYTFEHVINAVDRLRFCLEPKLGKFNARFDLIFIGLVVTVIYCNTLAGHLLTCMYID